MGGARGNEDGVTGAQGNVLEAILRRTIGDGALKSFARDAGLQADEHFRSGTRLERVPHLRLAAASGGLLVTRGVFVVRMDLHGELFLRKNELNQQRKSGASVRTGASPFRRHFGPRFA